jgi:hypothetical protein
MQYVVYDKGSIKFLCTPAQAEVLDNLITVQRGGIGTIHGYQPSTGYITKPIKNINFITRFSVAKLYERKVKALQAITFDDVLEGVKSDATLSKLDRATVKTLFEGRKAQELESLNKSLDGNRSDAHREGHDRCYVRIAEGVKVNLDCVKVDGIQQPVLHDGLPVAESIMLHYLELSSTTLVPGQYKVVNSGASVLMKNLIEKNLNARSVGIKTFSLKSDNFQKITVSRQTITNEDLTANVQGQLLMELVDL